MAKTASLSTPLARKKKETDDEDPGISNKQAMIYIAIVVVCFATLYPKMIHPMVKAALGLTEDSQAKEMRNGKLCFIACTCKSIS